MTTINIVEIQEELDAIKKEVVHLEKIGSAKERTLSLRRRIDAIEKYISEHPSKFA